MPGVVQAAELLLSDAAWPTCGLIVLFGDDGFLKSQALARLRQQLVPGDAEASLIGYDALEQAPRWADVAEALRTNSLFGGRRVVVVRSADRFVSAHRESLEELACAPSSFGVLVLEVDEWPPQTRLAKLVAEHGLAVACRAPTKGGKSQAVDEAAVARWVVAWGRKHHGLALEPAAARLLVELTGPLFGLLDQHLAKLALLVDPRRPVAPEAVQQFIGGWRAQTIWELLDAALSGRTDAALTQLDRLLRCGEHPLALVGSLAWSLRRYAAATRHYERAQRSGRNIPLREALSLAQVRDWPPGELARAEQRLLALGRQRAGQLYRWLLELDLALKGSHSQDDRARWALEQLLLRLAPRKRPAQGGAASPAPGLAARGSAGSS
jgi:DNA polymerase-3 subunit delta